VVCQFDTEPLGGALDRLVRQLVVDGTDRSGLLVDEVVVAMARVGDLVAGDAVAPVEAAEQPELEELLQYPVDRRVRSNPLSAHPVDDPLGVEKALTLPRKELDHRRPSCSRVPALTGELLLGESEPAIAQRGIDTRKSSQDKTRSQQPCAWLDGDG
jgi:hypothetical protein